MGFWNDVGTWFTGRNGIYKNDELVNEAIESLEAINGNIATNLDDPINKAISDLNAVKGMADYVGTLNQGAFDEITAYTEDGIQAMINQIEAKKKDMDAYERGSLFDKAVGTISMASGKVLDGFVSVFEGIGDAGLTVINWAGSGIVAAVDPNRTFDEVANNSWVKKAIEFDVSGTIASPLTNNPMAQKYSLFTADSGAASICKGIGKTAGYMFIGGQIAGFARGASGATSAMEVANAGRIANVLQSTTYSTALGAGVSGFGQGTETGLRSGKSFQKATAQGAIEGAVEGGSMLIAGKIGEHAQYRNAIKTAAGEGNPLDDAAKSALHDSIVAQGGFNNSITKAGLEDGFKAGQVFKDSGGGVKGFVKGNAALIKEDAIDLGDRIKSTKTRVSDNFHKTKFTDAEGKALKGDELDQAREAFKAGGEEALPTGVKANRVLAPVRGVIKTGVDASTIPIRVANKIIVPEGTALPTTDSINPLKLAATAAKTIPVVGGAAIGTGAGNATALGVEMALGGTTNAVDRKTGIGSNSDIAAEQFRTREQVDEDTPDVKPLEDPFNAGGNNDETPPSEKEEPTPPSDNNDPTPPTSNNSSTPPGDTGDSGNDGPSGGPSGGPGGSETQFRDPEYTNASNTSATNTASNTTTPNEATPNTPNTAANIVFQNNSASNTTTPNTSNTPNGATNTTSPNEATPGETIVTPADNTNPDNPTPGATVPAPSGGGTTHQGGGYTGEAGYTNPDDIPPESTESIIEPDDIDADYEDAADSISSIIDGSGSNFSKLPTNNNAIHGSSSGSAVIPVIAGLSAAAAAGIGAKAYMDRKNNNDNGDDDFEAEEWSGEEDLDIDYNDGVEEEQYLDDESDFGTEDEVPEKYGARNNDELADMQ